MTAEEKRQRQRVIQKRYRQRHRELERVRWREYYQKNKELLAAKKAVTNRNRYLRKRDELLAKNRAYHAEHGAKVRARQRQYRLENLEKRKQNCRDWYAAKKDEPGFKQKDRIRGSRDYQKHKAKRRAAHKLWLKRNPGYMAAVKHRRRLVENASKNLAAIKAWMKAVKSKPTAICYYCQETIPTKGLHFDHIVSIAKGGIHDVSNLCVSCPTCNLTKQDKHLKAWVRVGQQILAL